MPGVFIRNNEQLVDAAASGRALFEKWFIMLLSEDGGGKASIFISQAPRGELVGRCCRY